MKTAIRLMAVATGLLAAQVAVAQAPAGSTGQCKDGTYSTAASKQGACRGHQGVKEWYAAAGSGGGEGCCRRSAGQHRSGDSAHSCHSEGYGASTGCCGTGSGPGRTVSIGV